MLCRLLLAYLIVFHASLSLYPLHSPSRWPYSPIFAAGFAAKKPKPRKAKRATQHKGFGKAPPTIDEQIAAFNTRKPRKGAESRPCPCRQMEPDSTITYADCCMPLHDGARLPMTPTEVLRSRYSAFAWRIIGYLIKTTHPTCGDYMENKIQWAKGLDDYGMFDNHQFKGLTILGDEEPGKDENESYLEFQVHLLEDPSDAKPQGAPSIVQEKSRFIRDEQTGMWTYASGDIKIISDDS